MEVPVGGVPPPCYGSPPVGPEMAVGGTAPVKNRLTQKSAEEMASIRELGMKEGGKKVGENTWIPRKIEWGGWFPPQAKIFDLLLSDKRGKKCLAIIQFCGTE